jgi:hypothetical protein
VSRSAASTEASAPDRPSADCASAAAVCRSRSASSDCGVVAAFDDDAPNAINDTAADNAAVFQARFMQRRITGLPGMPMQVHRGDAENAEMAWRKLAVLRRSCRLSIPVEREVAKRRR